jgi:putative DNA primase/helicase
MTDEFENLVPAAKVLDRDDDAKDDIVANSILPKEPKHWPEPVDGAELFAELTAMLRRYLVATPQQVTAIALWVMFAHAHDAFWISPRLAILSPEKRCGKTTLLSILANLVPKPLPSANITTAALFRTIEFLKSPTLLIDEADTFLAQSDDLRGVINSGHNRPMAFVTRLCGDAYQPKMFSTWAPLVIAKIGDLPDTLADRSIAILLKRKAPGDNAQRFRQDRVEELVVLKRKVARFVKDNLDAMKYRDPDIPTCLHDRAADNWRPLLAIADTIGGNYADVAREAAQILTGSQEDESIGSLLLSDIRDLFKESASDRLASTDICQRLAAKEGRKWAEWAGGKPMTTHQLARLLKPFGIAPTALRAENGTLRGYFKIAFSDAFERYLPKQV